MSRASKDRLGRRPVAITGLGLVTSLGRGVSENWSALVEGRSGLKPITRFPTAGLRSPVAGVVDFMGPAEYSAFELSLAIARAAAEEALGQADIGPPGRFPGPLFIATPPSELEWPHLAQIHDLIGEEAGPDVYARMARAVRETRDGRLDRLANHTRFAAIADTIAEEIGATGLAVSVCTACASGVSAIQLGVEAIRRGATDAAICMGVDATVHPEGLMRFALLSALSTNVDPPHRASRPFARDRNGFVVAEGGAALVLEARDVALARGAPILGYVLGCGERADNFHRTRSKPDGSAIIGAIRNTLIDAGIAPGDIDHVNAHGTGTPENDKMEFLALSEVFGERVRRLPVTANKSTIGHTLIAAGAVEAVISLMTIAKGVIPPTMNCEDQDPAIPLDVVRGVGREAPVDKVLSNSFGFGGQNVCAVFSGSPD